MGKCHDLQHYLPGKIYKKPEILHCLQNRKPRNISNKQIMKRPYGKIYRKPEILQC